MLKGKTAVITGGVKGIGRYIAHRFAQEGSKVAILDVDEQRLEQTLRELEDFGCEALAVPTGVLKEETVQSAFSKVADAFRKIDIFVNDAGVVPHFNWGGPRWPAVKDLYAVFFWRVMGVDSLQ